MILASHLGRPDGKVSDGLRLRPVAERLGQLLKMNVPCTGDALGLGTEDAVKRLRPGEVLLLENLRFHAEEEADDPEFARALASYADVYVNDAFGTAHRAHASTVGVARLLPAYAGLLMEREIASLSNLLEAPERPFAAIVGGAKVSGKLSVLENLVTKVDVLVVGGGMANTFLLAKGHSVGKSLAEPNMVDEAKRVMALALQLYKDQFAANPQLGPADAQMVSDGVSGRVVVSARADQMKAIEGIFKQLEAVPATAARLRRKWRAGTTQPSSWRPPVAPRSRSRPTRRGIAIIPIRTSCSTRWTGTSSSPRGSAAAEVNSPK